MRAVDIIRSKRDGAALTPEQIEWMVSGITRGEVADYQWSALLMAILWRGMSSQETAALTSAMLHSGIVVDLSDLPGPKIDKHSTGGVGDKTSLILAPIVSAVGIAVPMVSGRGLGHTGGTLDKLESIPGFRVDLDLRRYKQVVDECGLVMIGQTREIAPADRFLYALRDATATVESIPLISASIMSKKLAEGIDGLVLDVKTGDGAFMQRLDDSRALAETMCRIGRSMGTPTVALITNMDQPLGRAVGNAVEVEECLNCLRGDGPEDLMDLSLDLSAEMVLLGGRSGSMDEARAACRRVLESGEALERFRTMIEAQGGDPRVVDHPGILSGARRRIELPAPRGGVVERLRARRIGHATMLLGAGRSRVDSPIDHAVGVLLHRKVGEVVHEGEPLCSLLVNDETYLAEALETIAAAYTIGDGPAAASSLILERLAA
jgi:pyrimidine-nucleoside phosphorylase/thymidine phosphorylase